MNLTRRPRRLRTTAAMRSLVAETTLRPSQLIQVFFVRDGITEPQPIRSMPGQYQHTLESIIPAVREAYEAGIRCIDLFGIPRDEDKDEIGSTAWDPQGILNRAIAVCREEFGDDLVVMADTCLDEFTSHGHCGVLVDDGHGEVAKSYTYTQHQYLPDIVIISTETWDGMTEEEQNDLREAMKGAWQAHETEWNKIVERNKTGAKEMGVQFYEIDKTAFIEACKPLQDEFCAKSEDNARYFADFQSYLDK